MGGGRRRGAALPQGACLDGDLLFCYFQLLFRQQQHLAVMAGGTRSSVMAHLQMLTANLSFF